MPLPPFDVPFDEAGDRGRVRQGAGVVVRQGAGVVVEEITGAQTDVQGSSSEMAMKQSQGMSRYIWLSHSRQ